MITLGSAAVEHGLLNQDSDRATGRRWFWGWRAGRFWYHWRRCLRNCAHALARRFVSPAAASSDQAAQQPTRL